MASIPGRSKKAELGTAYAADGLRGVSSSLSTQSGGAVNGHGHQKLKTLASEARSMIFGAPPRYMLEEKELSST